MRGGAAVQNDLVGFQECRFVVGMHLFTPHRRGVAYNLTGQAEFFNHRLGITKHIVVHVVDKDIIVGAFHQRII